MGIMDLPKKALALPPIILALTIVWNPIGFMNVLTSFGLLIATFLEFIGASVIYALTLLFGLGIAGLGNVFIALGNYLLRGINGMLNTNIPTGNFLDPMAITSPVREMWRNTMGQITDLLYKMQENIRDYVQGSWILDLLKEN